MNRFILLILNLAIISVPIGGVYLYFSLKSPSISLKEYNTKEEAYEYEKELKDKLYPSYDQLLKAIEEPKAGTPSSKPSGNLAQLLDKYILVGITYVSKDKKRSSATIKNKATNKQSMLKIGGVLEGATLIDIDFENSNIVFEKDGERYVMGIVKTEKAQVVSSEGISSAKRPPDEPLSRFGKVRNPQGKTPAEAVKIEKDQYTENLYITDTASVEYIKENLYKITAEQYVRPVFNESGERLLGIKIEQVKQGALITKVGLQANDIITKINGTELTSIQQIQKLFYSKELYDAGELTVTYLRDGKETTIKIKVQK